MTAPRNSGSGLSSRCAVPAPARDRGSSNDRDGGEGGLIQPLRAPLSQGAGSPSPERNLESASPLSGEHDLLAMAEKEMRIQWVRVLRFQQGPR